jgi:hypothetical protein
MVRWECDASDQQKPMVSDSLLLKIVIPDLNEFFLRNQLRNETPDWNFSGMCNLVKET